MSIAQLLLRRFFTILLLLTIVSFCSAQTPQPIPEIPTTILDSPSVKNDRIIKPTADSMPLLSTDSQLESKSSPDSQVQKPLDSTADDSIVDDTIASPSLSDNSTSDKSFSLENLPVSLTSPSGMMGSVQLILTLGIFTLAPAILIMTTSFVRVVVVLGLLRQALGVQNLPPQQVITGLALFITLFVMYPVGEQVYNDALVPYQNKQLSLPQAWTAGITPVRHFMSNQIQKAGNDADVWLFWKADPDVPTGAAASQLTYQDVPLRVLIPAFMISELKIAFLLGVKLFIPFLIVDFIVSAITVSMGVMMLPPVMISLPLKLLLFVMLDGWHLTVQMLLTSFG